MDRSPNLRLVQNQPKLTMRDRLYGASQKLADAIEKRNMNSKYKNRRRTAALGAAMLFGATVTAAAHTTETPLESFAKSTLSAVTDAASDAEPDVGRDDCISSLVGSPVALEHEDSITGQSAVVPESLFDENAACKMAQDDPTRANEYFKYGPKLYPERLFPSN